MDACMRGVEHGGYVRYVNMKTSICMSPIEEKGGTIPQKLSFHTLQIIEKIGCSYNLHRKAVKNHNKRFFYKNLIRLLFEVHLG